LKKINFFTYISLLYFENYFHSSGSSSRSSKTFFHSPVLVPVPTSWCQVGFRLQEPDPELPAFTLQTGYPHNTGKNLKVFGLLLHIIKIPSLDYQGFLKPNLTVLGLNTSPKRTLAQEGQPTSIGGESANGPDYASTACFFFRGLPICRSKMCLVVTWHILDLPRHLLAPVVNIWGL